MPKECNHYDVSLHLSPRTGQLSACVRLNCLVAPGLTELTFSLHRSLRPTEVSGDGVAGFDWAEGQSPFQFAPEAAALTVRFTEPVPAAEVRCIKFCYAGRPGITSQWQVNRLTPEWVELGLYTPWFPFLPEEEFSSRVTVRIDADYGLVGLGVCERRDGSWLLTQDEPGSDIVILAAPRLLRTDSQAARGPVVAWYTDGSDADLATELADHGRVALDHFCRWFGANPGVGAQPTIVIAPRVAGGGYARPGLVVMSRPENGSKPDHLNTFRWIAHEFAHLWWRLAPTTTWEDWLNESFAEYSALIALRECQGQAAYADRLATLRAKGENLPPLIGLPRNDEQAYAALYAKGPVILADLETQIGGGAMSAFLREALRRKVKSTERLLAVLADVAGDGAAELLALRLHG